MGSSVSKAMKFAHILFAVLVIALVLHHATAKKHRKKFGKKVGKAIGKLIIGNDGKEGGIDGKLKKAAVIGAVVYSSYQIGKLTGRYSNWGWAIKNGTTFDDWNRWREADGFLCRNDTDCDWVDKQLYCRDYKERLAFTPNSAWFGGNTSSIVGTCYCPNKLVFDNQEIECVGEGTVVSTNVSTNVSTPASTAASTARPAILVLMPLLCLCCFAVSFA